MIRRARWAKKQNNAHILEGYLKALDHLDSDRTHPRQRTPDEAKENLIIKSKEKWHLNNIFSILPMIIPNGRGLSETGKAILELRLQRLTGMEETDH